MVMPPPSDQPVDFSNKSYESFEAALIAAGIGGQCLAWRLRDMVFSALFHAPLEPRMLLGSGNMLYAAPGGWIAWLCCQRLKALAKRRIPAESVEADRHFLCLSTRSNHIQRIGSELRSFSDKSSCHLWCNQPEAIGMLAPFGTSSSALIDDAWAAYLDPSCIETARKESSKVLRALPSTGRLARSKLAVAFAIYSASLLFWRQVIAGSPSFCLTTYEKDPVAKAFLAVAREREIPRRVHWTHGLRHSSQRATLANELWCLTKGDVGYFSSRVPDDCAVIHRQSPESIHWVNSIGMLPDSARNNPDKVNFLVLGSGFDKAYTSGMSRADLGVVAELQKDLGDRIRMRFRPHPGNVTRFREDLEALGFRDIDFSTRSLEEDLSWSHAVGSVFSSVAIDVEPTGRPVFWLHAELRSLYSVDQLVADGCGTRLDVAHGARRFREIFGII